jgi:hypothetical protein
MNNPLSIRRILETTPALPKLLILFVLSVLIFFVMEPVSVLIAIPIVVLSTKIIVKKRFLTFVLFAWSIGTILGLIVGIPWIYSGLPLTPHKTINAIIDRWMYVIALPARFLDTVCVGIIFINTTSPLQLINWKVIGPYAVLLLRIVQYGQLEFETTITTMTIQHRWPEPIEWRRIRWSSIPQLFLHGLVVRLRNASALVGINFRNAILWFLPWGWIMFKEIFNQSKRRT